MKFQLKRYPSIASLALDAETENVARLAIQRPDSYFNGETAAESITKARRGDTALVSDAERLLSRISAEIETPTRAMVADVAGAYPVVAEFLMGAPDCMRRRAAIESDAAPIRVFACLTVDANMSAETVARRGVAVLALAIALSRVRPVELVVYNSTTREGARDRLSLIAATLNTQPLDIATAAYVLTSAGFVRRLCYNLARHHHFGQAAGCGLVWSKEEVSGDPAFLPNTLRRLGGDPAVDLIVGPGRAGDPLARDPVAWVNAQLAKFREAVQ